MSRIVLLAGGNVVYAYHEGDPYIPRMAMVLGVAHPAGDVRTRTVPARVWPAVREALAGQGLEIVDAGVDAP